MSSTAEVFLWGTRIGFCHLDDSSPYMSFEYDRPFLASGIEVAPFRMPLSNRIYTFPELPYASFHGAPGLLADSLPDRFGNAVINRWLASQGRLPESFNSVERLCYTGTRGMGALEYHPSTGPDWGVQEPVDLDALVRLAEMALANRETVRLNESDNPNMTALIKLGTSAGGARAKAVVAWNEATGELRSGQIEAGSGFGYWIIIFDHVRGSGDHGLEDIPEYTRIEYAYYLMACEAGIRMNPCRLFNENGRHHFMTQRFDRDPVTGGKRHMQTLGALAHIDYSVPGLCSYEEAALYAIRLGVPHSDLEEFFRRMVFNVAAVNQDDHVKNVSFLMDRRGRWQLSPAYDVTFAYDRTNRWLAAHQMTVNGKSNQITEADLTAAGRVMDIRPAKAKAIIEKVKASVNRWPVFAEQAGVREETASAIGSVIGAEGLRPGK